MAKKKQNSAIICFVALGCPKNIVDSEKMLAEIAQAGFLITADPENADVVVINTCGFIAPAKAMISFWLKLIFCQIFITAHRRDRPAHN
jgi:tRNA A37 methylthiotransferase MiaB